VGSSTHGSARDEDLVALLGRDQDERGKFNDYLQACVEQLRDNPTRAIAWPTPAPKTLTERQATELAWEEPDEEWWHYNVYVQEHGDPASNGKGHRVAERQNRAGAWEKCVVVPCKQIYRLKRRRVQSSELHRTVDDGTFQLGDQQLEDKHRDLAWLSAARIAGCELRSPSVSKQEKSYRARASGLGG
jgi:hypothetical protein